MPSKYTFADREWSASGARKHLLRAATNLERVGTDRCKDAARLIHKRWQSVAARPDLANEILADAKIARSIVKAKQSSRAATDRAERAALAAHLNPRGAFAADWLDIAAESRSAALRYADKANKLTDLLS